jgi:hypothetical protein
MIPDNTKILEILVRGLSFTVSELKKLQQGEKKCLTDGKNVGKYKPTGVEPPLNRGAGDS